MSLFIHFIYSFSQSFLLNGRERIQIYLFLKFWLCQVEQIISAWQRMMKTYFKGHYLDFTLTLQIQSSSTLFLRIVDRKCEDYVYELLIDDRYLQQQKQIWFNLFESPADLFEFLTTNFDSILIDNEGEILCAFKIPGLSSRKTIKIQTDKINIDRLWKLERELQNIRQMFQKNGFTESDILKKLNAKIQQSAVKIQENIEKKLRFLQQENVQIKSQMFQINKKLQSALSSFLSKQVIQEHKIQDLMAENKKALEEYYLKQESRKKEISCLKSQIEMFQKANSQLHEEEVHSLRVQVTEMIKMHIEKTVNCLTQELQQLKKHQQQKWAMINPESARLPQKSKAGLSYGHHPDNPHKQHFSLLHKRHSIIIQKQSSDYNWYNFINKSEVTNGKIAKYSVKLSKITDGKLYIGFGTKTVFGNASGWPSQGNYYHCFSGCVYQGGKKQDSGVKTVNGQTIIITADLQEQKITWMKGGKVFAECSIPQQMKGKSLYFVLQFNNKGNQVQLICD